MLQKLKMVGFLSDLADIFTGNYTYKRSSDLDTMRKDIMNVSHIPTAFEDRENLRNDLNSFLKDTLKAKGEIMVELKNGKTK
ncbi:hypothetical protein AQ623_03900 [Flavobacterium columnare]|nr:hypothetical protein AQ623_03900 [Flavobacterium columnare]